MIDDMALLWWVEIIIDNYSYIESDKIKKAFFEGFDSYKKNNIIPKNPYYVESKDYTGKLNEQDILCSAFNSGVSAAIIEKHPKEIIRFKQKCNRCGYEFFQKGEKLPKTCPKCRSPYWNKARKNEGSSNPEFSHLHKTDTPEAASMSKNVRVKTPKHDEMNP